MKSRNYKKRKNCLKKKKTFIIAFSGAKKKKIHIRESDFNTKK